MTMTAEKRRYRPTESQYKGTAEEMYITYDRKQKTSRGQYVLYPKVKRIYIAGNIKDWQTGSFKKKSGREVHGVLIEYEQTRKGYRREAYAARRGATAYKVSPAFVKPAVQKIRKIVEIPEQAQNVRFYKDASQLPEKYQTALQDVR